MTCKICGRKLRKKLSRLLGAGPTCLKKFSGLLSRKKLEAQGQTSLFDLIPVGGPRADSE